MSRAALLAFTLAACSGGGGAGSRVPSQPQPAADARPADVRPADGGRPVSERHPAERVDAARTLFPLGAADPDAGVAWVAAAGGGVEAVRLDDGATIWRSPVGEQPLIAAGGVLLVDDGATIVALDLADGAVWFHADPIPFTRAERQYHQVRVEAGVLRATYLGLPGALGGPARAAADTTPLTGELTVDLTTGRSTLVEQPATLGPQGGKSKAPSLPRGLVLPDETEQWLVIGSTLYALLTDPRVVRAFELPSGKTRWDHAVRELPSVGPIAP